VGYRICDGDAGNVDQVIGDTTFVTWIDLGEVDPLMDIMILKAGF